MATIVRSRGFGSLNAGSLWDVGTLSDPTGGDTSGSAPTGSYSSSNAGSLWGIGSLSSPTANMNSGGGSSSSGFDWGSLSNGIGSVMGGIGKLFGGSSQPVQQPSTPTLPSLPQSYYPQPQAKASLPSWVVPVGIGASALVAVALIARR